MNAMTLLVILLVAASICTLAIGAAMFFFQRYNNPEPTVVQNRLTQLKTRQQEESDYIQSEQTRKMVRIYKEADYQNEKLGNQLEKLPFFRTLKIRMQQAGMRTAPDKYFILNIIVPLVGLTLLGLCTGSLPLAAMGPLAALGSYGFVLFKRKQRLHKFVTLLPDTLGMITSSLRAGHSFQSALTVVSTEMPEPISGEFAVMVRDINLGIPVKEALTRLTMKLDTLPDVRMFATAVMIQREAGGNLAEVLEKLGYTIRERFKLKGQIAALTGQSRLTGYVLGCAPAVILVGLTVFMYAYVQPLWETDMGKLALGVVVVLQSIGFFVMKKIIDIRV